MEEIFENFIKHFENTDYKETKLHREDIDFLIKLYYRLDDIIIDKVVWEFYDKHNAYYSSQNKHICRFFSEYYTYLFNVGFKFDDDVKEIELKCQLLTKILNNVSGFRKDENNIHIIDNDVKLIKTDIKNLKFGGAD